MDKATDIKKVVAVPKGDIFIAPDDFLGDGLHIGGGWHALVDVKSANTTKRGLVMPAGGNWATLGGLGFLADPLAEVAG